MAKTTETKKLELAIFKATNKQGVFGCFEVTIGWDGKERVDYLTYDTNGVWRCYEIKVSKSDFYSKAKKTFVGNYNYFVMTKELYEIVKDEIPSHIGVYIEDCLIKRAKKQELLVSEETLKNSLIRSLSRENSKSINADNKEYLTELKNKISTLEKANRQNLNKISVYQNALFEICEEYGLNYKEVRRKFKDKI